MKIANICVSITGIFFRRLIFIGCRENSKHYMLAYPNYIQQQFYHHLQDFKLALILQISIFDLLYNKIYPWYDNILWEVVWLNYGISRPERNIIDKDHFKVYLSLIEFDE